MTNDLGEDFTFSGDSERQIGPEQYYGAAGRIIRVHDLTDAKTVISEVAQQGEGRVESNLTGDELRFHQPDEVAHYYRFEQILAGHYYDRYDDLSLRPSGLRLLVDWSGVYNIRPFSDMNSRYPAGLNELLNTFDRTYCDLLNLIHKGFNGNPEALGEATVTMQRLKYETVSLMQVEISNGETCGPPFWFVKMAGS